MLTQLTLIPEWISNYIHLQGVEWNYLSIPKLQQCNLWSLGMDYQFHPTLHWACDYLSMLGLKLNHVSQRDPWWCIYESANMVIIASDNVDFFQIMLTCNLVGTKRLMICQFNTQEKKIREICITPHRVETKWLPCCRQHFDIYFIVWKYLYYISIYWNVFLWYVFPWDRRVQLRITEHCFR